MERLWSDIWRIGAGLKPGPYIGIASETKGERDKGMAGSGGDDFVVEAAGGDDQEHGAHQEEG